jgi:hypothetical protein
LKGKVDADGRILSQEYWSEAGKADDRIVLPAPRTVVPYTGAQRAKRQIRPPPTPALNRRKQKKWLLSQPNM